MAKRISEIQHSINIQNFARKQWDDAYERYQKGQIPLEQLKTVIFYLQNIEWKILSDYHTTQITPENDKSNHLWKRENIKKVKEWWGYDSNFNIKKEIFDKICKSN